MNRLTTAVCALVLTASGALADNYTVKQTSDGFLNVRSGPNTSYDIMSRVYPNEIVKLLEKKGRWFRVRLPSGGSGWVSSNFLSGPKTFTGDKRVVQQTSDGFLNMRAGPGTGHSIVRRMYPGDRVTVLEIQGKWVRVRTAGGAKGWAFGAYMD